VSETIGGDGDASASSQCAAWKHCERRISDAVLQTIGGGLSRISDQNNFRFFGYCADGSN